MFLQGTSSSYIHNEQFYICFIVACISISSIRVSFTCPQKYDQKYDMNLKNTYILMRIQMQIERKIVIIKAHPEAIIKIGSVFLNNSPNRSMFYRL